MAAMQPSHLLPQTLGPYRIVSRLAVGGMGVVYRAVHGETREAAAVKTVLGPRELDLRSIRREIDALRRLSHPGVVRILGQGVDDGVPWYAMEMIEGRTLRRLLGSDGLSQETVSARSPAEPEAPSAPALSPASLQQMLVVLLRLCNALAFIHGEGIVHRDLKPENIVVRPDGTPVLVDFGLTSQFAARAGRERLQLGEFGVGTHGYMAPELIAGQLVDARADLYSVGCILYEGITGTLPDLGAPEPASALSAVPPLLQALIMRLLARNPEQRIGYADDIAEVLGVLVDEPRPVSAAASSSYLYRPAFVGRDEIIRDFVSRLDRLERGEGGVALIAGESGVGKTRVLGEMARFASRRRVTIVVGECVPTRSDELLGASGPPTPLPSLLRAIVYHCHKHPDAIERVLGRRRAVLTTLEPMLAQLPGHEPPAPVPLSPQGERARLLDDLVETVFAFARESALMLLWDDLQWADEVTLALLALLRRRAALPALIVGTYRSEEATPALLEIADRGTRLDRLSREAVGSIARGMLAMESPPSALVDFLVENAEGNPFFVSEYLRAAVGERILYRDAGGDWRVGALESFTRARARSLPDSIAAIVRRRVAALRPDSLALARGAAVLGRQFDLESAAAIIGGAAETTRALDELVQRNIIEQLEDVFRFTHDKIREVVYADLSAAQRSTLHAAAAARIEQQETPEALRGKLAPLLVHHWSMAGDRGKTLGYLAPAGDYALTRAAHREAADYYQQAIALDGELGSLTPPMQLARWHRQLGEAQFGLGDLRGSNDQALRSMTLLRGHMPRSGRQWSLMLVGQLLVQIAHLLLPRLVRRPSDSEAQKRLIDQALAAGQIATANYFLGDALQMIASLLWGVNAAERAGLPASNIESYARLGYIAGVAGLHRVARRYFERVYYLARTVDDQRALGLGLYLDAFYQLGGAHWRDAEVRGREAVTLLDRIGDRQDSEIADTIATHAVYFAGRFEESRCRYQAIWESARVRSNVQHEAWGMFLVARAQLALGAVEDSIPLFREAQRLLAPLADRFSVSMCDGLLAVAYWRAGDCESALRVATELERKMSGPLLPLAPCVHGYAGLAEVYLSAWQEERALPDGASARAAALRACARLRAFAKLFSMATPAWLRCAAWSQWLRGHRHRASALWLRSAERAAALAMPYDEAIAHWDLVRFGAASGKLLEDHQARASQLFSTLGAAYHLRQLDRGHDRRQ
jgi:tetratricopeptide (TPR) repeat protein